MPGEYDAQDRRNVKNVPENEAEAVDPDRHDFIGKKREAIEYAVFGTG